MEKTTALLIAFAEGDKETFYKCYNNEKYFIRGNGQKIPFLCALIGYSGKCFDLTKTEKKRRTQSQTEILRDLLAKRDANGYYYDVNEPDNSGLEVSEIGYKPLDIALILIRTDFAEVLLEREDIDLRKPTKKVHGHGWVEEISLNYAIMFCPLIAEKIIKQGDFSQDEKIYYCGAESATLRQVILSETKGDVQNRLLAYVDENEDEDSNF